MSGDQAEGAKGQDTGVSSSRGHLGVSHMGPESKQSPLKGAASAPLQQTGPSGTSPWCAQVFLFLKGYWKFGFLYEIS